MGNKLGSLLVGLAAGAVVVWIIQIISILLIPFPSEIYYSTISELAEYVRNAPLASYILVALSWMIGPSVAGMATAKMADGMKARVGIGAALLLWSPTVASLIAIPFPWAMWIAGIIIPMPLAWVAASWVSKRAENE